MCVSLHRELDADAIAVVASRGRLLASVGWAPPLKPGQTLHTRTGGPRAGILVIVSGEPTFAPRPDANAEPHLALYGAQVWLEGLLEDFALTSAPNAEFVTPMTQAERLGLSLP
jgi:hypothetical protein